MDKVLRQIKAQLAILNAFSDFYFLSMKQFFKLKCHMYTSNILNVGLSKTDNPAKSWTIEDPVSNYQDRCVPRKSFVIYSLCCSWSLRHKYQHLTDLLCAI